MADPDVLMRLTTLSTITVLLLAAASVFAGVTHSVNEENGLRGWRFLERDIEIAASLSPEKYITIARLRPKGFQLYLGQPRC